MPLALTIKSVNASADAVLALWDRVSVFEAAPSMRAAGYQPHITFAIYDAPEVTEELMIATMRGVADGRSSIAVSFDRIRTFPGPPLILWLDPEPNHVLLTIHHQIHCAIDPAYCHPHYRPEGWVPHCTLATSILPDRNANAQGFARDFRGGLRVVFDVIDCVLFEPVKVIAEMQLQCAT